MAKDRPPSYTPAPELPTDPELRRRFGEIVAVLAQTQTVTGAARALGLSRNHFQTILHRVIGAVIQEITPKPSGRPAKPEREVMLETENARLRGEVERLKGRSEMIERMMSVVGGIASGKVAVPRSRSKKTKSEDPEPASTALTATSATTSASSTTSVFLSPNPTTLVPTSGSECTQPSTPPSEIPSLENTTSIERVLLERATPTAPSQQIPNDVRAAVTTMREQGVSTALCAHVLGISLSTVRRLVRPKNGSTCRQRRQPDESASRCAREIVRATHGLIGARSLGKTTGLPRRACAQIKRRELREMEIERKARCARVSISTPSVIRGFDAMHVECLEGKAYWLVAADAAVPFRTSIATVPHYDAVHVIRALERDFAAHGPPLVLRLDRIACQRTAEVEAFLAEHQVLALHGPPRHPLYYGQLERQNREHRAWYTALGIVSLAELTDAADAMRTALNALWLRPTLDWCTSQHAWNHQRPVDFDRRELRRDVERQVAGLANTGCDLLRARRIAIESALTERGILTINQGGEC